MLGFHIELDDDKMTQRLHAADWVNRMSELMEKLKGCDDAKDLMTGMAKQLDLANGVWIAGKTDNYKESELMDLADSFLRTLRTAEAMLSNVQRQKKRKVEGKTEEPEEILSSSPEPDDTTVEPPKSFMV